MFNIYSFLADRPLSYSQIESFSGDYGSPEKWWNTYILNIKQESKELTFGSWVDKQIQNNPKFLPDLPRYEEMQYKMKVMLGKIPLVGIPDGLNLKDKKEMVDFKTGKALWSTQRANKTEQLTFYALLLYITLKIKPEDISMGIWWLPTEEKGDFTIEFIKDMRPKFFKTKRTMLDIVNYMEKIQNTVKDIEAYVNSRVTDLPENMKKHVIPS